MRIGLYGMPAAGKTFILNQIDFLHVFFGSKLLREYDPCFDLKDSKGKEEARKAIARALMGESDLIMDGHYSFGQTVVFTSEDGDLYDAILYLYVNPDTLKNRMNASEKNNKYLMYDLKTWQNEEIVALRDYCHNNNKDFYILDNPPTNQFDDTSEVIEFIRDVNNGYSCVSFARSIANDILTKSDSDSIVLLDGDKTLIEEDSSSVIFNYRTNLYDGNFYTGYQSWRQNRDFERISIPKIDDTRIHINQTIHRVLTKDSFILTSGHKGIWNYLAEKQGIGCYCGKEMSAETKLFVTKFLQLAGKRVIAYGDGMNDYYMLRQANQGYLVTKKDGTVSRSLVGKNLEGLTIV